MVNEHHEPVLEQILALLDTACQANLELLELYSRRETAAAQTLLNDLGSVVQAIVAAQEPLLPQLEHAYTVEMLENVEDTLEDIQRSIAAGNADRAAMKMECQLFPFLRQLKEAFYFWGAIYPDQKRMERYYREEFSEHFQNPYVMDGEAFKYDLSIIIPAYNHLDVTKRCVEHLLAETDLEKLHAELILVDHGSSDGTLEYFESLGVGKVIHFKHNIKMYMFTTLFQLCQGKYFALINNDLLVTKNWAEILLQCLHSDPSIIAAVPATPNTSNYQMIQPPTNDPEEFVTWAAHQNRSDPARWNDRARLMPTLGVYQTFAVNQIGFADPYFYTMEFWDDDFSLRARRAGYRQILCMDVSCYHFGSVTGKASQAKENTLAYGRELFQRKHGIDAWSSGFCYNYSAVQLLKQITPPQGELTLLGLDCGMGDTLLQIRNELRGQGRECKIFQLTCQKEYLPDLHPHFDKVQYASSLADGLCDSFGEQFFYCAYIERDIGAYEDLPRLLKTLSTKLCSNGWLIFSCENPFHALTVHHLLQFQLPDGSKRYIMTDPEEVKAQAQQYFSQVQMVPAEQSVAGLDAFAMSHFGPQAQQAIQVLKIQKYYFVCRK